MSAVMPRQASHRTAVTRQARRAPAPHGGYTELERRLLDQFQHGLPLSPRPYAEMAARLGVTETEVLSGLKALRDRGAIARVGAVFRPNTIGASTLAAMEVPAQRLEEVATLVSAYPEVNHNYQREHRFNLWFVVTAPTRRRVEEVLDEIGARAGLPVINLPMQKDYHIDLGFPLWC